MAHENKILHISLFVGLVGVLASGVAFGAVRIGNRTKNDAYRQVIAANSAIMDNQIVNAATETDLPVRVADADLAKDIQSGKSEINKETLGSCALIYPNGEFAWDKPTAGIGTGGASTCVAVVELRGYQMGPGGQDVVLARANVAAGSSIKCNISDFPELGYTLDAGKVVFPADAEPTVEDVKKVMNQEQRQNAGMKIAAATVVGGIGGNLIGKNDPGKDGMLGTDKGKMRGSLIGALGGAALMAGGTYTGYEAGNIILSTGVNAAAGGVVGNIMATGDPVLRIENCSKEGGSTAKCLWGYTNQGTVWTAKGNDICNGSDCVEAFWDVTDRATFMVCKNDNCKPENMASVKVKMSESDSDGQDIYSIKDSDIEKISPIYRLVTETDGKSSMKQGAISNESHSYVRIVSAVRNPNRVPAMVWDVHDKFFGTKRSDWYKWKSDNEGKVEVYTRNGQGVAVGTAAKTLNNFEPMYVDADDGGLVDFNNKARLKGTMVGAGVGGAAGAFTAYQGVQSDIDERWVAAVREYKDSLQKFNCFTGSRFLSFYNDVVTIPTSLNE